MLDWIARKRDGGRLEPDEVRALVEGVTRGEIPEYQAAAWLMAVYFRGMDAAETASLTDAMIRSGRSLDLSDLGAVAVDKHSTGGVGDKISLVLAPAVAACGGKVPMISGRALGHTGGTRDKLASSPGFDTGLSLEALKRQVQELGFAFGAATADLAPADRILYRLRDATCTVESIPLITSSILSKKAAEGIGGLVLDVKTGSGAFLSDPAAARLLAESMVATGERLGVRTVALLTDMGQPLGRAVGNALEVEEVIEALSGRGPTDVVELTLALGAEMLVLAGVADDVPAARARLARALADGSAKAAFRAAVERQGGDPAAVDDPARLPRARERAEVTSPRAGVVAAIDAKAVGLASHGLGAGRATMEDAIDPAAGIVCRKKIGEAVDAGEPLVECRFADRSRFDAVEGGLRAAFVIADEALPPTSLVLDRVARP
ncbi:MAG: thymidine phosphorylase [Planctomycetota bacterium JB042]